VLNDERGSLRSRGAAAVSSLTLRQISAVLPAEQAWGLWVSRQIVARPEARPAMRHIAGFIAHAMRDTRIDQAAG
jgi:hypothetical protein